jgi:hypothetical protein
MFIGEIEMPKQINMVACAVVTGALALAAFTGHAVAQTRYKAVDMTTPGSTGSEILGIWSGQSVGDESGKARFWPTPGARPVSLRPAGSVGSFANAINLGREVGAAFVRAGGPLREHAFVWTGTAASATDLNAPGFDVSEATGIGGNEVSGWARGPATLTHSHAILWDLRAGTVTDLHPAGIFFDSVATATFAGQQVGFANRSFIKIHAFLWQGTAASAVDLNPLGTGDNSRINGTDGVQQVGSVIARAYLWTGSAASAVPLGSDKCGSFATAVRGGKQVGAEAAAPSCNFFHATVWSGTPASAIDLHTFLPAGFMESFANAIDARGNIGGSATDAAGTRHAILWQPIRLALPSARPASAKSPAAPPPPAASRPAGG